MALSVKPDLGADKKEPRVPCITVSITETILADRVGCPDWSERDSSDDRACNSGGDVE